MTGLGRNPVITLLAATGIVGSLFFADGVVASETGGDPEKGTKVFARECGTCHKVGPEARNGIGPHLNGLFGRRAGSLEGFRYSKAMREAGENGLVWEFETLDLFIENPRSVVKGTRMSYRGLKDADKRRHLLAFLRQFSDNPRDIPEAAPTLPEGPGFQVPESVLKMEGDPAYGEYLASECFTCHSKDGSDNGISPIIGWPPEDFVVALYAYKTGYRKHPVMEMIARSLGDEEIAALAAYLATLQPSE